MNDTVEPKLIDRLVCSKYLMQRGKEVLDSESNFSAGLAVLNFQDAVELALRVIAEHHNVSLKENEAFNNIIDKIDKKVIGLGLNKVSNRVSLNQLNKTRVNFKHYAIRPESEDIKGLVKDVETFLINDINHYLGLDYSRLSLISLVKHIRSKNWLLRAEEYLEKEYYLESSACSRIAFEITKKYNPYRSLWVDRTFDGIEHKLKRSRDSRRDLIELARLADKEVKNIKDHIDILFEGIDPYSYKKFIIHTPEVSLSMVNTIIRPDFDKEGKINKWYREQLPNNDFSLANFCLRFALDSIIKFEEQKLPPKYERPKPKRKYEVKEDSQIIIYPKNDEVLRKALKGEILSAYDYSNKGEIDNFVRIFDGGMQAYISSEAVKKIDK